MRVVKAFPEIREYFQIPAAAELTFKHSRRLHKRLHSVVTF